MNKWYLVTAATSAFAIASIVWAGPGEGRGQGKGGRPGPHGGGGIEMLLRNPDVAKQAGVTDEQIAALKTAHYEAEKKRIDLQRDAQVARLEVKNLLQADTTDIDAIHAAIDKAGLAMTAMRKAQVDQQLKVKEVLGTETLAKLRELGREKMMERREQRGGRGGPGQGPQRERGERGERGPGVGFENGPEDDGGFEMELSDVDGGAPWMQDEMPPMLDDDV